MKETSQPEDLARSADALAALGNEARLRVVRLLLAAHPRGLVVGDIQAELGMPGSTLSHHLEKLKHEGLVEARRAQRFLWYTARTEALRELVEFLYAECCSRGAAKEKKSCKNRKSSK